LRSSLQPSSNLNYDLLVTYLTTPGTALYLGGNYNLADADTQSASLGGAPVHSPALINTGWQIFTKVSYLFRR